MVRLWLISIVSVAALVAESSALAQGAPSGDSSSGVKAYRRGEFIVKLRPPSNETISVQLHAQQFFNKVKGRYRTVRIVNSMSEMHMHHVKFDESEKSTEEMINELNGDPDVVYAEPNYLVQKAQTSGFSAESYYTLSQVQSFNGTLTTAPIDNQKAWTIEKNESSPTVVAIIDTGLDMTHPVFQHTVWTNPREIPGDGIDNDGNGYVDDVHGWNFAYNNNNPTDDEGHGTHVAGIVLGIGQNIFQSSVPEENILIMPLKFLDSTGNGSNANAISAIYYAANMGARVMNNSWGGGSYSQAMVDAIHYAYTKDSLFVAAAGNSTTNNDTTPNYPASYNATNEISVAATDSSDVIAYFSNFGTATVQLSGPGVSVLSTYPGNQYAQMSGTSMASPMIAGTVAFMRSQSPQMNFWQVKSIVQQTTDTKSNLSTYVGTSGRVNVFNAVQSVQAAGLSSYVPAFGYSGAGQAGSSSAMGCGLVSLVGKDAKFGSQDRAKDLIVLLALLLMPIVLVMALRKPEKANYRRRYERYSINSSVSFKLGDQELSGQVRSISLGGSDLNTEAMLKDGSVITMTISSPDGTSQIQVQGHVVWSAQNKRYGIAFDEVGEALKAQISQWTKALPKAS